MPAIELGPVDIPAGRYLLSLTPVPVEPGPPDPPDPLPSRKQLIRAEHIAYRGAFALPQFTNRWSQAWADSGMAVRSVAGQKQLISGSHRYSGDALFACTMPEPAREPPWPRAVTLAEWGYPYGDTKQVKNGAEFGWTHGLLWDEIRQRLYHSFGSWYNIPPTNDPSLAYLDFASGSPAPHGSWRDIDGLAHAQRVRGGALHIPDAFAQAHLGGRTLGLGFGGYYSGFSACSKGPHLSAVFHPEDSTSDLSEKTLIHYPEEHWCRRNPDYQTSIAWTPNPDNGRGYWGAMDECFACQWIDLPDKHGVLFFPTHGHGQIDYIAGDIYATSIQPWVYCYDPDRLAEVAAGTREPWDHQPLEYQLTPLVQSPWGKLHISGSYFDKIQRRLYQLARFQWLDGVEYHQLIHVWDIV